ncbi:deoxyadenosine/deoxycytidine kinase [Nitrosospira sp. Nsp2]|uniref:deoxynucleoside kinase n=1 Tax=Nitrosospira sp. Nsp2 TaxID=136548 RepID=UPI000D30FA0B|nr:deoxynucleoside kinase [Nitrosospira sp. Nsp2]PTR14820.1 deoxyadenosine/deoxycytidine kinase [Nitrosospira sp. Nsp2]
MNLADYRYIVIEGPIGAGKTSLARCMATRLGCELLLEQPAENPFLEKFYGDIPRYALSTQLFFLFQRVNQLQELAQIDMFSNTTVSDFMLDKDPLFARLTLNDAEYDLYRKIYHHLQPEAPLPDLVIYLQASPSTLVERVKRRGNAFENKISEEYLWQLADSYTRFFHQYEAAPLMIINSENLNFADRQEDFDLLLKQVEQMRGPREYFNFGI